MVNVYTASAVPSGKFMIASAAPIMQRTWFLRARSDIPVHTISAAFAIRINPITPKTARRIPPMSAGGGPPFVFGTVARITVGMSAMAPSATPPSAMMPP